MNWAAHKSASASQPRGGSTPEMASSVSGCRRPGLGRSLPWPSFWAKYSSWCVIRYPLLYQAIRRLILWTKKRGEQQRHSSHLLADIGVHLQKQTSNQETLFAGHVSDEGLLTPAP